MIHSSRLLRLALAGGVLLGATQLHAEAPDGPAPVPVTRDGGHALGTSGFVAGGYAAIEASDYRDADPLASLDKLSLLLWWENDSAWGFLSEIELEDALRLAPGDSGSGDADLVLERLHVDYAFSDALQLRIGKFLTPVGRWNLIHAAPLTWTTSRPLITESTFPTNATGAMGRGVAALAGRALEWSIYLSPGKELAPEDELDTFSEAYGGHLNYELGGGLQLGVSFVEFEQKHEREEHKTLYGVDFAWHWRRFELSGEWAYRTRVRGDHHADEQGLYVQAVAPITGTLYGIARYESFNPAEAGPGLNLYVGGAAWRWRPGWVAKLEYRRATDNQLEQPVGWLGSVAVLF